MKQSILPNFHILKECQDLSLLYNYITKTVYFIVLYYYIYILAETVFLYWFYYFIFFRYGRDCLSQAGSLTQDFEFYFVIF